MLVFWGAYCDIGLCSMELQIYKALQSKWGTLTFTEP